MRVEKVIKKLQSVFETLDYISDVCDDTESTTDGIIDTIRLQANGELAELEELIVELQTENNNLKQR